jgi:hypothetical protein
MKRTLLIVLLGLFAGAGASRLVPFAAALRSQRSRLPARMDEDRAEALRRAVRPDQGDPRSNRARACWRWPPRWRTCARNMTPSNVSGRPRAGRLSRVRAFRRAAPCRRPRVPHVDPASGRRCRPVMTAQQRERYLGLLGPVLQAGTNLLRELRLRRASRESDPASDQAGLQALQEGRDSALDELIARWQRPLFAFAWRYVQNRTDAHDLVAETFVRLHQQRDRLRLTPGFPPGCSPPFPISATTIIAGAAGTRP